MNILQLQERLKSMPKEQLVQEMKQPSGLAPAYMVAARLKEMTDQEKRFAAQANAQQPQTTVVDDVVAAAGVPQKGLGGIASAIAPRTDTVQNTGRQPTTKLAEGGAISSVSADLRDYMPGARSGIRSTAGGQYYDRFGRPISFPQYTKDPRAPRMPAEVERYTKLPYADDPSVLDAPKRTSAGRGLPAMMSPTPPNMPTSVPSISRNVDPTEGNLPYDPAALPVDRPISTPSAMRMANQPVISRPNPATTGGLGDVLRRPVQGPNLPAMQGPSWPGPVQGPNQPSGGWMQNKFGSGWLTNVADGADTPGPVQGPNQPRWGTVDYYLAILNDPNASAAEKAYARTELARTEKARGVIDSVGGFLKENLPKAAPYNVAAIGTGVPDWLKEAAVGVVSPERAGQMVLDRERNEMISDEDAAMSMPVAASPGAGADLTEVPRENPVAPTPEDAETAKTIGSGSTGSSISSSLSQMGRTAADTADPIMEQYTKDKWLALARAGAAMMMTPNVGMDAIGAGVMAGIEGLQLARTNRDDALAAQREQAMEEAKLALAMRAASARGSGGAGAPKFDTGDALNYVGKLSAELENLFSQADAYRLSGEPIPAPLAQRITMMQTEMDALRYQLAQNGLGIGAMPSAGGGAVDAPSAR